MSPDALAILRAGARARAVADALEREAIAAVLLGEHALVLHVCGPARRYPTAELPVDVWTTQGKSTGDHEIAEAPGTANVTMSTPVRVRPMKSAKPFWSVTVVPTEAWVSQLVKAVIVMGPSEKIALAGARRTAALIKASL